MTDSNKWLKICIEFENMFSAFRCVHLCSMSKVCIFQILKGNISSDLCTPGILIIKCLTFVISHFVLLSHTLFVHHWGRTVCLKQEQFQNAYEKSEQTITLKMVDQGRSDFYFVLTMKLCILESKQMLISLLF